MDQVKGLCEGSDKKEAFLDHKNIGLINNQNLHLFQEVSPLFLSKTGDFLIFCFYAKLIKKKCFAKVPKRKEAFLDHRKRLFKKAPKFAFF